MNKLGGLILAGITLVASPALGHGGKIAQEVNTKIEDIMRPQRLDSSQNDDTLRQIARLKLQILLKNINVPAYSDMVSSDMKFIEEEIEKACQDCENGIKQSIILSAIQFYLEHIDQGIPFQKENFSAQLYEEIDDYFDIESNLIYSETIQLRGSQN